MDIAKQRIELIEGGGIHVLIGRIPTADCSRSDGNGVCTRVCPSMGGRTEGARAVARYRVPSWRTGAMRRRASKTRIPSVNSL